MSAPVSRRDAPALTDGCTSLCGRQVAPHEVRAGGNAMVIARYRCPCGASWGTQWSTAVLPATSALRRPR